MKFVRRNDTRRDLGKRRPQVKSKPVQPNSRQFIPDIIDSMRAERKKRPWEKASEFTGVRTEVKMTIQDLEDIIEEERKVQLALKGKITKFILFRR